MRKLIIYLTTLALPFLLLVNHSSAQGYRIEARIQGLADTSLILSYRYGSKFYSLDTAKTDNSGYAVFEDTSRIDRGMYQLILPDKSFIDFFIDGSREISIKTHTASLVESLTSSNSEINQVFFEWQAANQKLRMEATRIEKELKTAQPGSKDYNELQDELTSLRKTNHTLWNEAISKLDGSLPGKFLMGMRPTEVPQEVYKGPDGNIDQVAQYEYYKKHFFDDVDWSEGALLRTPLIYSKLDQFFKRVVPGIPDSAKVYVDKVIEKAAVNREMFRFVVQHVLNYYSEPEIMGMDAVYVHIAEKYYLSGKADWINENNLREIEHRVNAVKPLLLGNDSPVLPGLETPEGEIIDHRDIKADFLVLYFWEPDCGFCKTATPNLFRIYMDYREKGVEILAVNTRIDKEPWEKFIAEHELTWTNVYAPSTVRTVLSNYDAYSTPKVFILDSEKKIVAKDISVAQVPQVLDHFLRSMK